MIVLDRPRLKFLLAGRTLKVDVPATVRRQYRKRHVYAVGLTHAHGVCHAQIIEITQTPEGRELELRLAPQGGDTVRLLGRSGGYTANPAQAMVEEPEAVDAETQRRFAAQGTDRWKATRAEKESQRAARSLSIRLKDAMRRGDRHELARLRDEIERVEAALAAA